LVAQAGIRPHEPVRSRALRVVLPDGPTAPLKTPRSGQFRVSPASKTRSMVRTRPMFTGQVTRVSQQACKDCIPRLGRLARPEPGSLTGPILRRPRPSSHKRAGGRGGMAGWCAARPALALYVPAHLRPPASHTPGLPAACGVRKRIHAARRYSWRTPPSRSRRRTAPRSSWPRSVNRPDGPGGCSPSARWGR
jgi:hypothetical protein